ncbi:hypothetical protein BD770DRAFT_398325 [Pilaira anomala]|nr:hypothetical protein BD770DRAFT_398325 [Pilaira anomala]
MDVGCLFIRLYLLKKKDLLCVLRVINSILGFPLLCFLFFRTLVDIYFLRKILILFVIQVLKTYMHRLSNLLDSLFMDVSISTFRMG